MKLFGVKLILVIVIIFCYPLFGCVKDTVFPDDQVDSIKVMSIDIKTIAHLPSILKESSGVVVSSENRIWSHCDSGNPNEIYLIDTLGNLVKTIKVTNVLNIDWEDLAVDTQGRIYINDAGNNSNSRTDLAIYRIPDPDLVVGTTVVAEEIKFAFEDQTQFPPSSANKNFDIEAIVWKSDSIFMFTKDRSNPFTGITKMYGIPAVPGNHIAKLKDSFYVDNLEYLARITAADINHQTGELVLLTQTRILHFSEYPNNNFLKGKIVDYQFTNSIGQAEAIGFINSNSLFVTEEGGTADAILYMVVLP